MAYSAKMIRDSVAMNGVRLTTMEITFPRIVLAEFNTHRVFSRNSASSRAIPVKKRIDAVINDPFIPASFGKNTKGMQAVEDLDEESSKEAERVWRESCADAIKHASQLSQMGVHKQLANRVLEPYSWHTVIVTATEWSNFFALRCNADAQPEIRTIAEMMQALYDTNRPTFLADGQWHCPYVDDDEIDQILIDEERLGWTSVDHNIVAYVSAGRCARVSYLTHAGKRDWKEDVALSRRLLEHGHMSPFEHVATPLVPERLGAFDTSYTFSGNFRGWKQFRKFLPHESDFGAVKREDADQ